VKHGPSRAPAAFPADSQRYLQLPKIKRIQLLDVYGAPPCPVTARILLGRIFLRFCGFCCGVR
jgi:hypothetical protein